ncbi:AcrR family transcriptional regulator [Streptomyces zagrosensis]|uniref:AcrR family transcriptional regulator n=1 Tax=Streptomyces zagrosensis TaxID=1042984 RepID=A0A7W9UYL6_9ACTN|nr:AcrR family transcriptional regulator [Streptomyces zagrosensis]
MPCPTHRRSTGRTGRPRSTDADQAILNATRAALVELGWGKLTMSDVAARAKVAKTTLYRRWASKNELVVDAVADLFDEHLQLLDRGSLHADVEGVVLQFAALLERPETKTALMAVVAEATRDEALRDRIRSAIVDRQKRLVLLGRERAQARGELPLDDDPCVAASQADLIFDLIAGTVVHRALVSGEPVDAEWAATFSALVVTGVQATLATTPTAAAPTPGTGPSTTTSAATSPPEAAPTAASNSCPEPDPVHEATGTAPPATRPGG